jgi:hypothetical protein
VDARVFAHPERGYTCMYLLANNDATLVQVISTNVAPDLDFIGGNSTSSNHLRVAENARGGQSSGKRGLLGSRWLDEEPTVPLVEKGTAPRYYCVLAFSLNDNRPIGLGSAQQLSRRD